VGDKAVFVMPTRHDPYAAFKRTVDMGANPDLPIVQALRGQEDYSTYTDYRGKEVLASWQYLPSYGWGLVAKIDIQEAFAPVVRLRNSIFLVTALIMLLSVSAASLIARSISEPIDRLCKGTEIIGSGNLDYKVDIDSSDEIGHLSRAFNNMASHLKHTTTSLDNINREIAEREKSEASVRRLAAIVESSDDAIIGKDLDGIITSWNKGAERLYGYTEKEIVGKQIFTIVPDDHRDELIMLTQKIRENQPVEHFETVRQKKDGTRFEASLSISPIKDSEGKVIGASTIARDISGRKKLEKLLQKYNEELEVKVEERTRALKDAQDKLVRSEKLAVVGQLASSVAHELRNPLGVIKNVVYYLNMLDLVKESPEVKDNLNIIVQEIENSDKIITDLLEFSHSKKPVFLPEDINLIVKEILDRMRISPGIELVLDLKDGLPEIEVDALQIHQVLYNITKNALEAMENGGRLTIKTALVDSDAFVGVSISDTGPAISKENRPKIFEPLFSTKTKGTGLGLSVCSSIVEHHGGSIEVISEAERETTFTVKLPVKRA